MIPVFLDGDCKGNGSIIPAFVVDLKEAIRADLDGDGDYVIMSKPYTWKAPRLDIFINETKNE